jgi:ankyrin repeat protein
MASLIKLVLANNRTAIEAGLAQGAQPNERDEDGRTPLIHAAIDNQLEVAKLLLDSGADVDAQDESGNSALHYAAQEYHVEMASLLVGHGATLEIEDSHGNTPLSNAVFYSQGRGEVIGILLRAGADKNRRNRHGVTPIGLAKSIGNYDVAQFLK